MPPVMWSIRVDTVPLRRVVHVEQVELRRYAIVCLYSGQLTIFGAPPSALSPTTSPIVGPIFSARNRSNIARDSHTSMIRQPPSGDGADVWKISPSGGLPGGLMRSLILS